MKTFLLALITFVTIHGAYAADDLHCSVEGGNMTYVLKVSPFNLTPTVGDTFTITSSRRSKGSVATITDTKFEPTKVTVYFSAPALARSISTTTINIVSGRRGVYYSRGPGELVMNKEKFKITCNLLLD